MAVVNNNRKEGLTMQNKKAPQKEVMRIYNLSRSGLRSVTERLGLTRYYLGKKLYYDLEEIENAMTPDNTLGQKKGGQNV